jgi:5-hydroxyisourate hydrolase-like protein (transthyretin family)
MRKLGFALGILVLPFAFHSVQSQAAETKTGTATVSGRVTLKGEPARGVTVILQTQSQNASNAPRARTDESGRFNFTGILAGRYSVSAVAPGYFSPDDSNFGQRGKTLNVADGEKVENLDIEIKRGGVIAGKVVDSQGRPAIEERINLSQLEAGNRSRGVFFNTTNYDMYLTDDRGFYRIYGVPEGRYLVSVGYEERSGSGMITSRREFYPRVFYPNATSVSEAKVIEVREGSEATNIDITVPDPKQTYDVDGRVVDAGSGQPVAGVEVVIVGMTNEGRYSGYGVSGTRSGPNGEFRIFGVAPGKHAILARPDEQGGGFISDPVIVDIGEGAVTGVEVRVRQGASISGVVVIEGTNDPKVHAKLSQVSLSTFIRSTGQAPPPPNRPNFVKINADGIFHLRGVPPGKAMISVTQMSGARDLVMSRIEQNGAPVSDGIEVEAGEQVTGVRVVLAYGSFAIRGELRVVGGAAPAGLRFFASLRRVDQPAANTPGSEIDARGQFVLENLPPGEYDIRITPMIYSDSQSVTPEFRRLISSIKARVVLSGGDSPPIVLTLDLSGKEKNQ